MIYTEKLNNLLKEYRTASTTVYARNKNDAWAVGYKKVEEIRKGANIMRVDTIMEPDPPRFGLYKIYYDRGY